MIKNKKDGTQDSILSEFDSTGHIANHYGFTPIVTPKIGKVEENLAKNFKEYDVFKNETLERLALLEFFQNSQFVNIPQPALFYFKKPFPGTGERQKNFLSCGLEIIGGSKPLSEAIIIKTAWAILSEYGNKNLFLDLNFVGDKESFSKFEKELASYFRKNISTLSSEYKQKFKNNLLDILICGEKDLSKDKVLEEFCHNAPKPMNSLSESSREHFKEVLEFLESLGIPYKINNALIPNKTYASHTIFQIFEVTETEKGEENILVGYGGRYNYLAKKSGQKKDIPSCGATIFYKAKKNDKKYHYEKLPKPKFYVVQLGNHAKLKLLNVIERLRVNKIPVYHSLTKEKISGQLNSAEYLKVSHLLIMGQKEAIDNSIVVRSMDVREQETVLLDNLTDYLKDIK